VQKGLIQKGGAWFTVGEERFQGRDNVRAYLEENPDVA
jgi:recombination protein RecA